MALMVIRNTFWELGLDKETEELPRCLRRSNSDPCIHHAHLMDKIDLNEVDVSDETSTVAGTSPSGSSVVDPDFAIDSSDSASVVDLSSECSVDGSNERELWADIIPDFDEAQAQIPSGPPGTFAQASTCQVPEARKVCTGSTEDEPGTAIMVRNIPSDASRAALLTVLDAGGFAKRYNFVYLPMDFQKGSWLGYAIVNFADPTSAAAAVRHLSSATCGGNRLTASLSDSNQSLFDLVLKYRNSSVMHWSVPDLCKPVIFIDGIEVPFPGPTTMLKAPSRIKHSRKRLFL